MRVASAEETLDTRNETPVKVWTRHTDWFCLWDGIDVSLITLFIQIYIICVSIVHAHVPGLTAACPWFIFTVRVHFQNHPQEKITTGTIKTTLPANYVNTVFPLQRWGLFELQTNIDRTWMK